MKFGIIGAMDCEIEFLQSRCCDIKEVRFANLIFFEGTILGQPVVLVQSGIGKVNAALCTQILILKFGVTHVLNTGIAGAMDKRLRILDTVVSTDCVYHDVDTTFFGDAPCTLPEMPTFFNADKKLIDLAKTYTPKETSFKFYFGRIASGDQFICKKEIKEEIEKNCHPMCVEMEGTAVAHVCIQNKIPFLIIRSISDNADENVKVDYVFNKEVAAGISGNLVYDIISKF
ncbi:MAG: 5'-methylthioadenosine/adenosylhomocysteine nucleosidase [Treponemataceae bacterium]